jgi:hypothetical protein
MRFVASIFFFVRATHHLPRGSGTSLSLDGIGTAVALEPHVLSDMCFLRHCSTCRISAPLRFPSYLPFTFFPWHSDLDVLSVFRPGICDDQGMYSTTSGRRRKLRTLSQSSPNRVTCGTSPPTAESHFKRRVNISDSLSATPR